MFNRLLMLLILDPLDSARSARSKFSLTKILFLEEQLMNCDGVITHYTFKRIHNENIFSTDRLTKLRLL